MSRSRRAPRLASRSGARGARRPAPAILGTLLWILLANEGLPAQGEGHPATPPGAARVLVTPDGSRFLLQPTGGPPVLAWVVRTPAGPVEERDGEAGLAFAVARAAMAGTTKIGAIDHAAEQDLLQRWDADELRTAQLALAGLPQPPELDAALAAHRAAAVSVADPLAFERALRATPASASRLSQTPQAMLLHLELTVEAVAAVADLLVRRREDAVLRNLHDELRAVRAELAAASASDAWAPARDEVRWLAYRGHPLGRPSFGAAPVPTSRARAREVFARTHRPERTRHVLVGGFDPAAVEAVLVHAFARSGLPTDPVPLAPPIAEPRGEVTGRIASGTFAGTAVAYRTPADAEPAAVAMAAAWLADGDGSFLARALRASGIGVAEVRVTHPFPAASAAPFVLVEVRADARQGSDAAGRQALTTALDAALSAAASATPTAAEWNVIRAQLTAREQRQTRSPGDLATHLALLWDDGVADPRALAPVGAQRDEAVTAVLRAMLERDRRVRVTQEPTP